MSHVRMFDFWGGVPELVIPDNENAAVRDASRYEADLNPTYQELATHYGTTVLSARPGAPRDKAKVEAAVQNVERWIMVPLRNQTFFSLGELRDAIAPLLATLNERPFDKTEGSSRSWFEDLDRPAWPPSFVWAYCKVNTVRSTRAAHRGKITSNYWNRDPVPAGWVVASATAAKYDMFPAPQADRHGTGKLRRESVAARSSATYPADGVAAGIATNIADGKSCFTIYRSLMRGVCVSYRRSACAPGSAARRQARARRACTRWTGRGRPPGLLTPSRRGPRSGSPSPAHRPCTPAAPTSGRWSSCPAPGPRGSPTTPALPADEVPQLLVRRHRPVGRSDRPNAAGLVAGTGPT